MSRGSKPFPEKEWWKDLPVDVTLFQTRLAEFTNTVYDFDEVEFTHDVLLERLELAPYKKGLRLEPTGLPQVYYPGCLFPGTDSIVVEGPFLIGQAGNVEGYGPEFRLAFLSLGKKRPVYCQLNRELVLRRKS